MNKEEIENRIIVCEMKANAHREVGNTKTVDRYDNEKHKWEKILSDLELLDERKIKELLDYKKGYFDLEQENQELKNKIKKLIKYGYGTNMTLGEFKEFYKLATGKDYDPKKCPEVE